MLKGRPMFRVRPTTGPLGRRHGPAGAGPGSAGPLRQRSVARATLASPARCASEAWREASPRRGLRPGEPGPHGFRDPAFRGLERQLQIMALPEVEPELRRRAEEAGEARRRIGGDPAPGIEDQEVAQSQDYASCPISAEYPARSLATKAATPIRCSTSHNR